MHTKSKKLFAKYNRLLPKGIGRPVPFFANNARGAIVTDVDGKKYIDFTSGIAAVNLGHAPPAVVRAIQTQARKFIHTCFLVAPYENYLELAQMLHAITPGKFAKKTFLANSGAEAVENAIKIAKYYTGRSAVISFTHGFHGRTLLTLSLTSKVKPYKFGFGPFAPEIYKLEYPYMYRRPDYCQTEDDYVEYLLHHIEGEFFKGVIDPQHIAAIIIEPIAGEGGFICAPERYLQGLQRICRKYGIVFIVDEVQTGFGRTGKWFASEWSALEPDILVLAKSLASGMPLSAVVGRATIMDSVPEGGLGGTFGGNPVCVAAALATIKEMKRLNCTSLSQKHGEAIKKTLLAIMKSSPIVGDVRGKGSMWALEIVRRGTKSTTRPGIPDPQTAKKIIKKIIEDGVMVLGAGIYGNVVRILPPLTIATTDLQRGLRIIQNVFSSL